MNLLHTLPSEDGYYMPAEYSPHRATVLIWPTRPGSWTHSGAEAQPVFAELARHIAEGEEVYILADSASPHYEAACRLFADNPRITMLDIATDDAWARDVGPTCVVNNAGSVRGVDWQFNAWGGDYDGLYAEWTRDNAAARAINSHLGLDTYDAQHFVLEGGSIHSDGQGTLIVTEACLLSPGRNPELSRDQIEARICQYLGCSKVIWLPRGIYNDETNEHVDNVCAFVGPAEVVLAVAPEDYDSSEPDGYRKTPVSTAIDSHHPQHDLSALSYKVLSEATDAQGRPFNIHCIPVPKVPVTITQEELDALAFEEGEDMRETGEMLAASYVNFYIANTCVLVPQFGDENDRLALDILKECFPTRKVVGIAARPIIVGGGNIHCITQQIPQ